MAKDTGGAHDSKSQWDGAKKGGGSGQYGDPSKTNGKHSDGDGGVKGGGKK